jgi:hypothetical protein
MIMRLTRLVNKAIAVSILLFVYFVLLARSPILKLNEVIVVAE